MSDKAKFWLLLTLLVLSLALAFFLNSSYSHMLLTHQ